MIDIVVALIGLMGVVYAARAAAGARSAAKEVHAEVKTNHGKTAGQYLEMIQDVKEDLAAHTEQDDRNFRELRDRIDQLAV